MADSVAPRDSIAPLIDTLSTMVIRADDAPEEPPDPIITETLYDLDEGSVSYTRHRQSEGAHTRQGTVSDTVPEYLAALLNQIEVELDPVEMGSSSDDPEFHYVHAFTPKLHQIKVRELDGGMLQVQGVYVLEREGDATHAGTRTITELPPGFGDAHRENLRMQALPEV